MLIGIKSFKLQTDRAAGPVFTNLVISNFEMLQCYTHESLNSITSINTFSFLFLSNLCTTLLYPKTIPHRLSTCLTIEMDNFMEYFIYTLVLVYTLTDIVYLIPYGRSISFMCLFRVVVR